MSNWRAILSTPQGGEREVDVTPGFTCGRSRHATLTIEGDLISGHHFRVVEVEGVLHLEDTSTNGTELTDRVLNRGETTPLVDGLEVRFEESRVRYCSEENAANHPDVPPSTQATVVGGFSESSEGISTRPGAFDEAQTNLGDLVDPSSAPGTVRGDFIDPFGGGDATQVGELAGQAANSESAGSKSPESKPTPPRPDHSPIQADEEPRTPPVSVYDTARPESVDVDSEDHTATVITMGMLSSRYEKAGHQAILTEARPRIVICDPALGDTVLVDFELEDSFVLGSERNPQRVSYSLKHPTVSRRHLSIRWNGQVFALKDLGSRNGTFVRGPNGFEDIGSEAFRLKDETCFRVGAVSCLFLTDKGPSGEVVDRSSFDERVEKLARQQKVSPEAVARAKQRVGSESQPINHYAEILLAETDIELETWIGLGENASGPQNKVPVWVYGLIALFLLISIIVWAVILG